MTLAEKHKIKAEEKKLEKEEARAKFRLNQIKPTTNACFNILFVLLSFVCLFPVLRLYDFRFLHGFYHKVRVQAFPGYIFHGGVHVPLE